MLIDLFSGVTIDQIATNIAVIAATVILLKQWVRSDIAKLSKDLDQMLQELNDFKTKYEEDMEAADTRMNGALRELAKSVEEFVRRSTDDKIRYRDEAVARDNLLQIKVASLDVTVTRLERTVDKFEGYLNDFAKRVPKT